MRKILMAVLISTSTWAVADDNIVYTCKMADKVRLITVVYAEPGKKAPCTVDYQVDGVSKTLWNYPNSVGHCEKVAEEFAAKQKGWGWACTSSAEAAPTAAQ
jgi:hypothetical protein